MHIPCARNTCQYVLLTEAVKIPRIWKTEPSRRTGRKNPESVSRPDIVPMKKSRKIWMEPIQDTEEGGEESEVT
jgi:hypothetical protein